MQGRMVKGLFFVGVMFAAVFGGGVEGAEVITAGETTPGMLIIISGGLLFLVRRFKR